MKLRNAPLQSSPSILLSGCAFVLALSVWASPVSAGPDWTQSKSGLGSISIDGDLRYHLVLGRLAGSPELSFPVELRHRIREDAPVSEFMIPQLTTYVAPEGRDQTVWMEPGGLRHYFPEEAILKEQPESLPRGWTCISPRIGEYEFLSGDGWSYQYQAGTLKKLLAPTGREMHFETVGVSIRRVYQVVDGKEVDLLRAELDEAGAIVGLEIGANKHAFSYHEQTGQLLSWQPPGGMKPLSFTYKEDLIVRVDGAEGRSFQFEWGNRFGNWQEETGLDLPEGEGPGAFLIRAGDFNYNYGINTDGINMVRIDRTGVSDALIYNPRTKQLVYRNRDGGEVTRLYGLKGSEDGRLSTVRDPEGRVLLDLKYDELGRVVSRKDLGEPIERFEYDDIGRIQAVYRLEDRMVFYEYDGESGRPARITNVLGDYKEFAYNDAGQVTRYRGLEGDEHQFIYDSLGRLIEHQHPYDYSEKWTYDEKGRLAQYQGIDGEVVKREYDEENRLKAIQDANEVWSYEYDEGGALKRLQRNDQTWQEIERQRLAEGGERVKVMDYDGDETVLELDEDGNVKKEVNALGQATEFRRDELGQLKGWTDPRGVVAEFERDVIGRVVGLENAEGPQLGMTYDKSGRLVQRKTPEQNIRYEYDREGRLTEIDYGKGQVVTYEYDQYGRIKLGATPEVKTHYDYDLLDRVIRKHEVILEEHSSTLVYQWTPSGRKASLAIYRNGQDEEHLLQKTDYHYDHFGRYTSIDVNGTEEVTYDYNPETLRLKQKNFASGMVVHYDWDEEGRPALLKAVEGDGTVTKDVRYEWSDAGKLDVRIIDGIQENYHYDALGRLIAVIRNTVEEVAAGASTEPDPKVFEDLMRKAEEAQKRADEELRKQENAG